jgi:DNA-binding transcriptional LysR family regulator
MLSFATMGLGIAIVPRSFLDRRTCEGRAEAELEVFRLVGSAGSDPISVICRPRSGSNLPAKRSWRRCESTPISKRDRCKSYQVFVR